MRYIVAPLAKVFGFLDLRGWDENGIMAGRKSDVGYDVIGMAVRYGLQSSLAGLAMWGANTWLHTSMSPGYALAGFLAGPVAYFWKDRFDRGAWVRPPWFNPAAGNAWFEISIGALLYGGLVFAA